MDPPAYATVIHGGGSCPKTTLKIVRNLEKKSSWQLTDSAWKQLLSWLDQGTDSGGKRYLEIRRRLVAYFDRKNCSMPDALADETLNRVARRLEEEGAIETDAPAHYCYIVARYVFLEYLRQQQKTELSAQELRRVPAAPHSDPFGIDEGKERRLECLDQCVGKLDGATRELIVRYYHGNERAKIDNRRALATELGLSANALTIRACRIRGKLETCVRQCAEE